MTIQTIVLARRISEIRLLLEYEDKCQWSWICNDWTPDEEGCYAAALGAIDTVQIVDEQKGPALLVSQVKRIYMSSLHALSLSVNDWCRSPT